MFSVFDDVRKQIRFRKKHPTVESAVFVCMKVAMVATLLGCVLCTAKTYIGDNINCITGFTKQQHRAIETYCFIASTFSMVNLTSEAYPGVGPGEMDDDNMTKHAYYQWVPMVLVMQVAVLYFPRWFWKNFDKDRFKNVLGDADAFKLPRKKCKLEPLMQSAKYMASTPGDHTRYALQFLISEVVAVIISIGNLFFTNVFLGDKFFGFGGNALSYLFGEVTDIENPLNQVFPKITKCTWHKFGPTGSIQSFDSMCVLPLNIVNEKTYVFLWLVYIITTSLVAASLLWHIVLLIFKKLRDWYIMRNIKDISLKEKYIGIKSTLDYGDWFIMKHLSVRMVPSNFEKWLSFYAYLVEKRMKKELPDNSSESEFEE